MIINLAQEFPTLTFAILHVLCAATIATIQPNQTIDLVHDSNKTYIQSPVSPNFWCDAAKTESESYWPNSFGSNATTTTFAISSSAVLGTAGTTTTTT